MDFSLKTTSEKQSLIAFRANVEEEYHELVYKTVYENSIGGVGFFRLTRSLKTIIVTGCLWVQTYGFTNGRWLRESWLKLKFNYCVRCMLIKINSRFSITWYYFLFIRWPFSMWKLTNRQLGGGGRGARKSGYEKSKGKKKKGSDTLTYSIILLQRGKMWWIVKGLCVGGNLRN